MEVLNHAQAKLFLKISDGGSMFGGKHRKKQTEQNTQPCIR